MVSWHVRCRGPGALGLGGAAAALGASWCRCNVLWENALASAEPLLPLGQIFAHVLVQRLLSMLRLRQMTMQGTLLRKRAFSIGRVFGKSGSLSQLA